jgi:hypothetical protein
MWASVCFDLYKAHTHGDCCEAMHACVGVCVWACTRRVHAHIGAVMPTRVFPHKSDHAHAVMHT